ncbi:MAG: hypothetical protein PHT88_05025 [Candidatus Moranbacteria bacterium]|nr:hypothetical protein [Candidatus Moranbacteria bacterium]
MDTSQKEGRPEYVEVEMASGFVTTITDLQKVASIIWPDTDIERIWLSPAKFSQGVRLINVDIEQSKLNASISRQESADL